jgi:polyisoprenoid-binding protein YceI
MLTSLTLRLSIAATEGDFNSAITGNLAILDSTKSITFNANVNVSEVEVSIISEDFAVDRRDWGIVYHVEGTEGVPIDYIVANDMGFTINVVLSK